MCSSSKTDDRLTRRGRVYAGHICDLAPDRPPSSPMSPAVAHIARDPRTLPNAQARKSGVVAFVFRDLSQPAAPDAPPAPVAAEPTGNAAIVVDGIVERAPGA